MASERRYSGDVPVQAVGAVRAVCAALPETEEADAWVGVRWSVRRRTFAHVFGLETSGDTRTVLAFRSSGEELEMLRVVGHPFFVLGWGRDALGLFIDADTDWAEVAELITESYCVMAPKKLVTRVRRSDL